LGAIAYPALGNLDGAVILKTVGEIDSWVVIGLVVV